MYVLIAYDIANKKRLRKVARLLESHGVRVQKSVFECRIGPTQLSDLLGTVKPLIKPREDRIHIYRICENCRPKFTAFGGCSHLPDEEKVLIY